MFPWAKTKTSSLLGVDISSNSVKILEVSQSGGQYRVERYGIAELPPSVVVENEIKELDAIGQIIRTLMDKIAPSTFFGAVAIAGTSVITKVIQMQSSLNDDEILAQLAVDAERFIPYPLDEVYLDFHVLGPNSKTTDMNDVLLAASRSEHVDGRVEALLLGGISTKIVDVEAYAIERAYQLMAPSIAQDALEKVIAILDIGASTMGLCVVHQGKTIYTREQSFGGKQLIEEIQRRYNLSPKEAFQILKSNTVQQDFVEEVLTPFRNSVAQQVNRALQFFFSSSSHGQVDHIVLAGGVASIPGVLETVQENLEVPTSIANPFLKMDISDKVKKSELFNDAPSLLVALGLALRSFDS